LGKLKHGHGRQAGRTAAYRAWKHMRERCNNPNAADYGRYGGRGIRVCTRWDDYSAFLSDLGDRPGPTHSLDRIDVNGNYEPGNCRWADIKTQARNRRETIFITIDEDTRPLKEWVEISGVSYHTVFQRLKLMGWEPRAAIFTPARKGNYRRRPCP
jgi:hypothetical protein